VVAFCPVFVKTKILIWFSGWVKVAKFFGMNAAIKFVWAVASFAVALVT
jgi:hypothetical protein